MNIKDLLTGGLPIERVLESIEKGADAVWDSGDEKREHELIKLREALKFINGNRDAEHNLERTHLETSRDRHQYDMMSDNANSKNIRPDTYKLIMKVIIVLTVLDSMSLTWAPFDMSFNVRTEWVSLWGALALAFTTAYTGFRSWEKVTKIRANADIQNLSVSSNIDLSVPANKVAEYTEGIEDRIKKLTKSEYRP